MSGQSFYVSSVVVSEDSLGASETGSFRLQSRRTRSRAKHWWDNTLLQGPQSTLKTQWVLMKGKYFIKIAMKTSAPGSVAVHFNVASRKNLNVGRAVFEKFGIIMRC